jgi:hypothetical protein
VSGAGSVARIGALDGEAQQRYFECLTRGGCSPVGSVTTFSELRAHALYSHAGHCPQTQPTLCVLL